MAVRKRPERLSVKTARVPDKAWNRAARRAEREGTTISNVVATFVQGYADGLVDLPVVHVTWTKQGDLAEAAAAAS